MATATEYVITDRTTATKYALKVTNGEFFYQSSTSATSPEPVIEDDVNAGTYWRVFLDDGELAYAETATVQDDNIQLEDSTLNIVWRIIIDDGQLGIENIGPIIGTITAYTIDPSYLYEEEIGQTIRIVEMESGKEKRMKFGSPRRTFTLRYDRVTLATRNNIENFFVKVSGSMGRFAWLNPLDSATYTCRLLNDSIEFKETQNEHYNIQLQFIEEI